MKTLIVPQYGYEMSNAEFIDDVWALLESKISKRVKNFLFLGFDDETDNLICEDKGGGEHFFLEWLRGKELTLADDDIEDGKAFIQRRIAAIKAEKAHDKIYGKYEKILAPILSTRPDKVSYTGLVISEGQPIITLHFDNGMIAFIDTKMQVSYEWEKTVSNAEQAREYMEKFNGKLSEIQQTLQNVIGLVPVEFWEGAQNDYC